MSESIKYCPKCGAGHLYIPFYGPYECINQSCQYFNQRHYDCVKPLLATMPAKGKITEYECNSEDDEQVDPGNWFHYSLYSD